MSWKFLSCSKGVHNEELKSLTRYRFDKVRERAKLKSSVSRLVCILFPELEKLVSTLHMASVYALLNEFPGHRRSACYAVFAVVTFSTLSSDWGLTLNS